MATSQGDAERLREAYWTSSVEMAKNAHTAITNPASRRENIIKITPKGRKLIDKLWPEYDALLKSRTDILPKDKQEELAEILKNWFLGLQK